MSLWTWLSGLFGGNGAPSDMVFSVAQVRPGVFRSRQPATREEWLALRKLGIRHVIKLNFESEASDNIGRRLYFDVRYMPIQPEGDKDLFDNIKNTFVRPLDSTLDQIQAMLDAATVDDAWLVHCTHGQDRTGLAVGRDRVLHSGWSKDTAYAEMLTNGFHPLLRGLREYWEAWRPTRGQ